MPHPVERQNDAKLVFRSFGFIRRADGTFVRDDAARSAEFPKAAASREEVRPEPGPWAACTCFLWNALLDVEAIDRGDH
jgi:hypothetical protein